MALIQKTFDLGTFLDIEGAFDNAFFDSMIIARHELEPPELKSRALAP
jgi:hypothetical protein